MISYLRVSTARQGQSGLGLAAQRAAVAAHAAISSKVIVAEYLEVESGSKAERPQLALALEACRLHRAVLVIAKLDRLARNVAFIANLMDGGVEFIACDMPHANRLTLHIMAAMAEYERRVISDRTKAALSAAKERGVRMGNPNGASHLLHRCREAAAASAASRQSKARDMAIALAPILQSLREQGVVSPTETAVELNRRNIPTSTGGHWHPTQVQRVQQRLQSLAAAVDRIATIA
ncbi:MAG TPA: recombinase family protein [Burkholderiales bacterium]|nr:recombinase family protein [Burkholderiales bacterium]